MYVAIPPDRDSQPVRVFKTFTADLECLADWLIARGITTVAMESTGVYWIPLYQMLEDRGGRACLVNARRMKNVPGRRTDWHECQWLQYLHTAGLLRAAFRPEQDVCGVRTLLRHRNEMVRMAVQHVLGCCAKPAASLRAQLTRLHRTPSFREDRQRWNRGTGQVQSGAQPLFGATALPQAIAWPQPMCEPSGTLRSLYRERRAVDFRSGRPQLGTVAGLYQIECPRAATAPRRAPRLTSMPI
jgi:hypothetical protein